MCLGTADTPGLLSPEPTKTSNPQLTLQNKAAPQFTTQGATISSHIPSLQLFGIKEGVAEQFLHSLNSLKVQQN